MQCLRPGAPGKLTRSKYFRHMLEARHVTVLTDYRYLTFAFYQKRDKCSPRQLNHLHFTSQFTEDIRHLSGQDNIIADALFRVEAISTPVKYDVLTAVQKDDELPSPLVSTKALQLEKSSFPAPESSLTATTSLTKNATMFRPLSAARYLIPCISLAITESRHRLSLYPNALCGQPCRKTAVLQPELANPASASSLRLATLPYHLHVSFTST